jgi:hypothetical protein
MNRRVISFGLCLALVGCGTPQEQCIARETRDLRVVDTLITETEGNLMRGYALEEVLVSRPVWVECLVQPANGEDPSKPWRPRLCLEDEEEVVTRPKAVDLAAEQAKLNSLKAKRVQLAKGAERSIAACRTAYPE